VSSLILFDSKGRVYVDCFVCGDYKATTTNTLCQVCLREYNSGKIKLECPKVKQLHDSLKHGGVDLNTLANNRDSNGE